MSSELRTNVEFGYAWQSRCAGGGRFTTVADLFKVTELSFAVIVEAIDPSTGVPFRENSIRGTFGDVPSALIEAEYWAGEVNSLR